ncbi:hypothetical protein ACNQF7_06695 [Flavobacterium sp. RSP29]|uniref:hypothetical protein n=1 Tax=Flavobacterium sp. RSP29 TaxID=3401731 RepID=UPI003AACCC7D
MTIHYSVEQNQFYEVYEIKNSNIDYTTPSDEHKICRYCNSPNATFKSKAHLLPEFMGNKDVFCSNECDSCNNKFGVYETHLNAFSGIKNTLIPIKGKKKYPKFKDKNLTTQFIGDNTVNARVEKDSDCMELNNGFLNIKATTQTFIPLYVHKALVKFGLSMIDTIDLPKFKKAFDWIDNPQKKIDDNNIPLLLIHNEARPPIVKPIAFIAKRKTVTNSPEFTFVLAYGFHRLQIFLPFNSCDQSLGEEVFLPLNFDFVTQKIKNQGKWSFGNFDMNSLKRVQLKDDFKVKFNMGNDKS